jgi:hypothetical protein
VTVLWEGQVRSGLASARQLAICSVVPTDEVDSSMTKLPFSSRGTIASAGDLMNSKFGLCSPSSLFINGVGTTTINTSAGSACVVARRFPIDTVLRTTMSRSDSTI